jgi:hypothetical protein
LVNKELILLKGKHKMSTLFQAVNASATTANGAVTNLSSLNANVDLFFLAGASRGKDLTAVFSKALVEDPEVAVRVLEWCRDARGGAGERDTFRKLFGYLIGANPDLAARVLVKVPELGRWDDLLMTFGTPLERDALRMIAFALQETNDGLAAKWMDRQGPNANKIRSYMKLTPKGYRKLIVGLSNTVEQKMCAQDWTGIVYPHVPSVAAGRYQKAFLKHDPTGYGDYKAKLVTGEAKINASVAYPYDVIRSLNNGDEVVSNAQWAALPNYLEGSDENILPIVDVSGSMDGVTVSGSVTAMDVAISLGLYLSERLGGAFKDQFVTFSTTPKLQKVSGSLKERYSQMESADWGMSTNIQAVFKLVLSAGVKHSVAQSEMPTKLLILSDMEFDSCISTGAARAGVSVSAMEMIEQEFAAAGYKMPQIVFWNLNGRAGNSPVTYNKVGAALVSGFSPSIVKSVLGGEEMTPISIMLKTVMCERYDF